MVITFSGKKHSLKRAWSGTNGYI